MAHARLLQLAALLCAVASRCVLLTGTVSDARCVRANAPSACAASRLALHCFCEPPAAPAVAAAALVAVAVGSGHCGHRQCCRCRRRRECALRVSAARARTVALNVHIGRGGGVWRARVRLCVRTVEAARCWSIDLERATCAVSQLGVSALAPRRQELVGRMRYLVRVAQRRDAVLSPPSSR
jgi:hypothetical protein